jgi:3-oxoacyl-[acyl-carrier-protein] synthase II
VTGVRVAVTGVGVVAPCGIGRDAFWAGLLAAPEDRRVRSVDGFDPTPLYGPKEVRRVDRFAQFALAAATEALDDSGELGADPARCGVVIGTGVGGLATLEEQVQVRLEKGERRVSPFLVPMMMSNAAAAGVSMRLGWRGPCETITTACAAGTHSIGAGLRLVQSGRCDVVLAGGTESALTATAIAGFANMTALSSSGVSRPNEAQRHGVNNADGPR